MSNLHDDDMAAADKELEERANRAKAILSARFQSLSLEQVRVHRIFI